MTAQFGRSMSTTRRAFLGSLAGTLAAASPALDGQVAQEAAQQRIAADDPGISWILTPPQREEGAALLNRALGAFLGGEWIGVRQGRDAGMRAASVRRYLPYLGGPQIVGEVEVVGADGIKVFRAAKHMAFSPSRKTLVTYFFEIGADVQIFVLDPKSVDQGRLMWQEVLRRGRLFRVEETIPKNDEFKITVWQQDAAGAYQTYASETLSREWRETYKRRQ